jgi:hypothetical protein
MVRFLVALSATIVLSTAASSAQLYPPSSSPSLQETTKWLAENLPISFTGFDETMNVMQRASYDFHGCTLTMRVTTHFLPPLPPGVGASGAILYWLQVEPRSGLDFGTEELAVPDDEARSDTNAIRPLYEEARVSLSNVRLGSIVVKRVVVGSPDFSVNDALNVAPKLVAFAVRDSTLAARLAKAMRRAAQLCGARDDPF